jgi:hypothetical protein
MANQIIIHIWVCLQVLIALIHYIVAAAVNKQKESDKILY